MLTEWVETRDGRDLETRSSDEEAWAGEVSTLGENTKPRNRQKAQGRRSHLYYHTIFTATLLQKNSYFSHFTDGETEAQCSNDFLREGY
jgi:hypothetical protein